MKSALMKSRCRAAAKLWSDLNNSKPHPVGRRQARSQNYDSARSKGNISFIESAHRSYWTGPTRFVVAALASKPAIDSRISVSNQFEIIFD